MRRRRTLRTLTNTRIYRRGLKFSYFSRDPIENPRTKKVARWHVLCRIDEGEDRARELAREIIRHNTPGEGEEKGGGMIAALNDYQKALLAKREENRPKEAARVALFLSANADIKRQIKTIKEAFGEFDVHDVIPADVAKFVDQWDGRRTAAVYKSRLSHFFAWACRKGLRTNNPAREISVEKTERRMRYLTDEEYHAIRDALATSSDGKKVKAGEMIQCFLDLTYLTMQRPTEVRLLKWSDIDEEAGTITFKPTKTERSSGASVAVTITPQIRAVLERARGLSGVRSFYVIRTRNGQPYTTFGIRSAWGRACERAGVSDATTRDVRAKAITDAKRAGFAMDDIRVAAAHTNESVTKQYIKTQEVARSSVSLFLPKRKAGN